MISYHSVFAPFLNIIQAYGCKTRVDEKCWDGCYSYIREEAQKAEHSSRFGESNCHASRPSTDFEIWEFCYNLRYVERNGRNHGDPWSLRQTGVYHSYDYKSQKSIWIILQPSTYVLEHIENVLRTLPRDDSLSRGGYMLLHCFILSSMERNWRDYIEDLQTRLDGLVSLIQTINIIIFLKWLGRESLLFKCWRKASVWLSSNFCR